MTLEFDPFKDTFETLENLADTISDVLGCPITIEDTHHRVLAYSSHNQEVTDEARLATIIGRRVPEKVINGLWKAGVIQALSVSEDPVRVPSIPAIGLGNRIAIAIRKNHELLGYIWALETTASFGENQLSSLKQAARAASTKLLQLKARKKKEEEGHQEFFWRLLTGHVTSHSAIAGKAQQLKIALPATFSIVIFQFDDDINVKTEEQITYIITTTQRIRVYFSVVDRSQLILLVGPHGNDWLSHEICVDFIQSTISRMAERFGTHGLHGGCGNTYQSYEKIRNSYQEASTVLELKQRFPEETRGIYDYHRLGFYRFLPIIMEIKANEAYTNYSLQKLRDYDNQHHADLLQTLEVFLNYDCNIKDAAEALHVHMNTLNYRLKRISEIGEIDLKNINQKLSLYLDLKIEKLLK